ncbi:hypothetical protein [Nocardiopsis sp. NRRL B-16309]|uniref:hypothetical protein n=1 Tax=Nocardiopsis sp. NRRL B-16309 TaxID=1519494 RepID=UPI0006ADAEF2|nr:hypothetical protein [Nocardiopsis sp. NRRL B-16309]KOX24104.1 hypothetical protein ADL05_00415 [Nocardiopsis sp. NRRL B-16309]
MSGDHLPSPDGPMPVRAPGTRDTAARTAADLVGVALIAPLEPGQPDDAVRAVQALLRHALHS